MLQYVGQQQRERQGWGKEDEAVESVRLCVCMSVCVCVHTISGLSHFSCLSTHTHTADVQFLSCQQTSVAAEI